MNYDDFDWDVDVPEFNWPYDREQEGMGVRTYPQETEFHKYSPSEKRRLLEEGKIGQKVIGHPSRSTREKAEPYQKTWREIRALEETTTEFGD